MELFNLIAVILLFTTIFSYINYKWLKLPETIGLMVIALLFSLVMLILKYAGFSIENKVFEVFKQVDFSKTVLGWMLSFLLFAGSLNLHVLDLAKEKWVVGVLALFGTIATAFMVGGAMYFIYQLLGINIPFIYALLFGALISPTDPIAVLAMLKNVHAPRPLQATIAGESLFNDGVGIVIFLSLLQFVTSEGFTTSQVIWLFLQEAFGGVVLGLILGWIIGMLIKNLNQVNLALLISLTVVTGGYSIALLINTSGPIAMVVAGLVTGYFGRFKRASEKVWETMDTFWALIDEILNALLFVLIGFELLAIQLRVDYIIAGVIAIAVVLLARLISVWIPIKIFSFFRTFPKRVVFILTWGGLRGALPVAMALTMPPSKMRAALLTATYIVVIFSILVQGLTTQTLVLKRKN